MPPKSTKRRNGATALKQSPRIRIEDDPTHHLTGPFLPQTPLDSLTPRSASPVVPNGKVWASLPISPWLRWAVRPASAFKLLLVPVVLFVNWELLSPYLAPGLENPFACFFLLSGHVTTSSAEDPRYAKTYLDLVFLAYHIVFFSLVRQLIAVKLCTPIARYFGLKREAKIDRFGEQGYALVYFAIFGAWGYRVMTQLPTYWYQTEYFWIDYPHWDMIPELKRYYLMQMAYWCQQLIVLVLGLEKPRKDYWELVAHHLVTLWLVGWSYLLNLTRIGNAVYMSMDIPDTFLAFSKLLNYIQWERAKVVSFVIFILVWTYFRHYLNLKILWSVWFEIPLAPESSKTWNPAGGAWLTSWMPNQIFAPLFLLQLLNLFWYYLMMRILYRAITTNKAEDERSDDEDEGEDDKED
ncbi:putative TRAM, LAG1 and CLN8 homology domains containing protein [Lyophyllum shimeji]|uniref:TRAM, LAG1 and CLN8 homology domains containing protein n=1 Tax=Lyophyllum shimeji TaxID=47721 RepID=A0A9P3PDJ0_LYOSH|nr:putative TRAM, LAG1 and CLN8 homology domains containing protein [Lyophyllum shimeji]